MLFQILSFEVRYWLRSWMVWIFLTINALMIFGAVSTDQITVGTPLGNTFHNAPFVIERFYAFISLFMLIMGTAFVNSAAVRDFSLNTYQIIFSTPLRKFDFLVGRFLGAVLVSVVPSLGVSLGILAGKYMPWVEPHRWGPVILSAHLNAILVFAIPNAFFIAAILFAIAVLGRNEIVSFVGSILLLVGYAVSDAVLSNLEHEKIAALLDPFGIRTLGLVTKYWTVAERNTVSAGYSGLLLWNRVLWIAVAVAIFIFAYFRFSFAERNTKARRTESQSREVAAATVRLPTVSFHDAPWSKFVESARIHFIGVAKSTVFIVVALAALLNTIPSLALRASEGYGNSSLPVTYWVLQVIASTLYIFIVAIITYFAGLLVWKDRDTRMDEIVDATPSPEWVAYGSRLFSLVVMVFIIQVLALASGLFTQIALGYHRFQFGLYAKELFLRDGSLFVFLAVLAFFIHVISPNKYVGYFAYIAFLVVDAFVWSPLNVATNLVQFGKSPTVTFSDFYGDAPYRAAWDWFTVYWVLFCGILAILTVLFWPRGKESVWRERLRNAGLRFRSPWPQLMTACVLAFLAVGGWIYYNTKIINTIDGPKDLLRAQAEYEKTYKKFAKETMPRVRSIKYWIDIYPEDRNMTLRADEAIYNASSQPLSAVHFNVDRLYDTTVEIPGATLTTNDRRLYYQIYTFSPPLQPGEERTMHIALKSHNHGFENEVSNNRIVQNGTFFDSTIAPRIGYDSTREITDPNDRKRYGLKDQQDLMPLLERNCTDDCRENYLGGYADWVDAETTISTSPDQIAVAPGSLIREWQENGRRYFDYKLDHPSLFFFSFISARYEVARAVWNGINVEVYYLKEQPWNVPRMVSSIKKSLDYYIRNFGPYYHKEARIIEFPRVAGFAQAFPGTMPYSESIGFIANLNHPDDIDMVFYVVGHEMGHQWWAHQVVGANMEGATLLSETLAQYSALMVMEKEYGRDIMRKFLKFEMDNYLRSRGAERLKEHPLLQVESSQGYIHYRKGSVVLYYLKEMIGEEAVNRALRKVIQQYAYAAPPYPTSWVLYDAFQEQTPPDLQYLLKDLFEDIIIFSNRTTEATAVKRADGKYDVTIKVEAHKYKADAKGNETEVPVGDWIDIGAFAKPDKGKKYGKTLYRQRIYFTSNSATTKTFTVDEVPDEAGIDPFHLLIDRVPDSNTKKVTIEAGTSSGR
jgi:ABC-type transport system involved in multi-copper enzyme maturation permease subunit